MDWTTERVLDFAPDASTAESGQALANPRKWLDPAFGDNHLWGQFKTRKGDNYLCIIELNSPAFHCSCKSQKAPCKHIVGLLHLYTEKPETMQKATAYPDWVKTQLKRFRQGENEENQSESPEDAEAREAQNEANRMRNRSKRMLQMEQGLVELESWLLDLMRQGLAATEANRHEFWTTISTRLVDAKLGGIARQVRMLSEVYDKGLQWPAFALDTLAHIYLLVRGFRQIDRLPPTTRRDVLSVLGVNQKKDELLPLEGVRDDWMILGQLHGKEEKINFRRSWIHGIRSNKSALILEFAWGDTGYMTNWPPGKIFSGEMIYYPSAFPQRVLVKDHSPPFADIGGVPAFAHFEQALQHFAKALGQNPWLFQYPMGLAEVIPVYQSKKLILIDQQKSIVPVEHQGDAVWKLLAISGGQPVTIFGEWNGNIFALLSVWHNDRLTPL
ncbi:MAG: SWIM zinc finger family protein [Bacteroidota bacterium]